MRVPLRVAIDARRDPGSAGGMVPALKSLVTALGALDGPEEYRLIVASASQQEWLAPLAPNQQCVVQHPRPERSRFDRLRQKLRRAIGVPNSDSESPASDGFFEGLGCGVIHFPLGRYVVCGVPTVYNPHDLLHLHFPQFLAPHTIMRRDRLHRTACHFASTIVVNSQWVKEDVANRYAVAASRIQVIPEAAPTTILRPLDDAGAEDRVRARYGLEPGYAFYPSVTWPHKNHLRLLEAIARLRDGRGVRVCLVCTGAKTPSFWPEIERRITALSLGDQVRFLGFVPQEDMPELYRLAGCLVLPTLFEANSLPMFEAWQEETPVISSNVTALPEQAADAALLFDPLDEIQIADAIHRGLFDPALRQRLAASGRRRLTDFDWQRTAIAYRAVYRSASGLRLGREERDLLAWDWMRHPSATSSAVPAGSLAE